MQVSFHHLFKKTKPNQKADSWRCAITVEPPDKHWMNELHEHQHFLLNYFRLTKLAKALFKRSSTQTHIFLWNKVFSETTSGSDTGWMDPP